MSTKIVLYSLVVNALYMCAYAYLWIQVGCPPQGQNGSSWRPGEACEICSCDAKKAFTDCAGCGVIVISPDSKPKQRIVPGNLSLPYPRCCDTLGFEKPVLPPLPPITLPSDGPLPPKPLSPALPFEEMPPTSEKEEQEGDDDVDSVSSQSDEE